MDKKDTFNEQMTDQKAGLLKGNQTKGFQFKWQYAAVVIGVLVVIIVGFFLYRQLRKSDPEYYTTHFKMGLSFLRQGQLDPAVKEFRIAANARPESLEPHYGLGMAYFRQRKYEDAVSSYEEALRLAPSRMDIRYSLGLTYQEMGRLERALEEYHLVVKEDPKAYQVFNNVGIIQMKLGDYDKAIRAIQHSIEIMPGYFPAHFNLARAYEINNNIGLALKQYQLIKTMASKKPETKEVAEIAGKKMAELSQVIKRKK